MAGEISIHAAQVAVCELSKEVKANTKEISALKKQIEELKNEKTN